MKRLLGQPYAELGGVRLCYDLFLPEGPGPFPVVIAIHGGGWISGERSNMHDVAPPLCSHGIAVACPDYRLAPLNPFPAAVKDVQSFARYLRAASADLGLEPDRVGTMGVSAGGHLAAMLSLAGPVIEAEGDCRANAGFAICPLTDLSDPYEKHFPISHSFIEQFMGGPYEGREDLYRSASPLAHVSQGCPPLALVHGSEDDIVPFAQSEALYAALQGAGCESEFHPLPGEGHGFSLQGWSKIEGWLCDFFQRRLG
ncbi:MAG: alpha/beta hydrolase [Fimbriimonadaceae bacterium]|nr:alpha/beta hydrolase [Fimbriimonadaceae bacterium]